MQFLKFFGRYARRYTGWILLAAISIPLYGLGSAGMVAMIEPIFAEVLLAGDAASEALPGLATRAEEAATETGPITGFNLRQLGNRGYRALKRAFGVDQTNVVWFVPLLFFAVYLIRALMAFLSQYSFRHIGLGVVNDIRNELYRRLLAQSSSFHSTHPSGELISRLLTDVGMLQAAISNRLLDLLQESVTLIALLLLLLSTDFRLAVWCLVVTPLVLFPLIRFGESMRRASRRGQERMAGVTALLSEGLRGHRVVKAFGMEEFEARRFARATRAHLKVILRGQVISSVSSPVIESIAALGSVALFVYAGLQIRQGNLTAPLLVQFVANLMLMYDPIRKLNNVNLVLQQARAAMKRVRALLDAPNEVTDRPGAITIDGVHQGIRFDGVHFGYGTEPVLRGIDLDIRPGEIVALVGPSGAGKTSLVNLLPRFFDPTAGRVTLDGRDIRDITLASLRRQIGIVTQETMLFNDTIRDNIAYGRADVPLDQVREAARAAFADEFIMRQPAGYDTVIGESGSHLSGGQRQRLSIARA
ncbi:MAG TPA: ABC transporter ATP-binding protein, partial [Candidatus Polarisedimenticolaceae bacterium]|nr:ABC transporter ATP-binding protein [Candidatus Polarisedimenticolaceae bacterium]